MACSNSLCVEIGSVGDGGGIREAMVWKIKEMPLMEKYRMCRGRKAKKEPTVTPPLFCLSFLSVRAHRDVAAAFRLHQKSDDKRDTESDMDLICIAIHPHLIAFPNVTAGRLL